jgi:hypothetical protein
MIRRYAFTGVGSSGATSRCPPLHMTLDTIDLTHRRFIRYSAEYFTAKTLLLASSRSSDESLIHRRFIQCYCSSLCASLSCLNSAPVLPSNRPSVHLAHLQNGPSVHPTVPVDYSLCAVYQVLRRIYRRLFQGTVSSSDDVFLLPFLYVFNLSLLNLTY